MSETKREELPAEVQAVIEAEWRKNRASVGYVRRQSEKVYEIGFEPEYIGKRSKPFYSITVTLD